MENVHDKAPVRKKEEKQAQGNKSAEIPRAKDWAPRGAQLRRQGRGWMAAHRVQQILHHLPRLEEI
eukprot:2145712-Heterocapsa_arctica.AAC.1